jgi:hypothetical protein
MDKNSRQQKVCRKAGGRNNNRQLYYYQLISGLTEFYLAFVVNFNISFLIGFSCRADTATIPALRQASNVSCNHITTLPNKSKPMITKH